MCVGNAWTKPSGAALVSEQVDYYRNMARSGRFDEAYERRGRYDRGESARELWLAELDEIRCRLDQFCPRGAVLELACGTGMWTQELVRHARSIVALDAAPEMLAINQLRVPHPMVRRLCADVFEWDTRARFDVVLFGLWLSHVPDELFEAFWERTARWLMPGGRVFVIDSMRAPDRTGIDEELSPPGEPVSLRRLDDGRTFRIIKVFHNPDELVARLAKLGWVAEATPTGQYFFTLTGARAASSGPTKRRYL